MTWATPLAWLLAAGILGPLAAHLLSRRTPTTYAFPTLRFVGPTATSARRLRTLHDPWLLALRLAIVLVVAGAAAGPTLATSWRRQHWEPPLQTAYVHAPGAHGAGTGTAPRQRDSGAVAERDADDAPAWHYEGLPLRDSLARAVEDLQRLRSTRRQIVVRWGGDTRELAPSDLRGIPDDIGLRLEPQPAPPDASAVTADASSPSFAIEHAPDDEPAAAFLATSVSRQTAWPVAMVWPGAAARSRVVAEMGPATGAADQILRRMQHDPRLLDAARRSRRDPRSDAARPSAARARPLAWSADGDALMWGGTWRDELVLVLDASPRDPAALWSLRAVEDAALSITGWPRESRQWTADELAAHQRPPGTPPEVDLPTGLDTRWWWMAALVLLLVEQVVRRRFWSDPAAVATDADGGASSHAA